MRPAPLSTLLAITLALAVAACGSEPVDEQRSDVTGTDPLLTNALGDPLMVDPDLAYRNQANSAIAINHDHALPPLEAREELAERAREAARRDLLRDGPIPDLPFPLSDDRGQILADLKFAGEIVTAVGGPSRCNGSLEEGLVWAANMSATAAIMPHGMVQQAAGTNANGCTLRVVRYLSPAGVEDALQYHYTRADRARLRPALYESPEMIVAAEGREEALIVHAREGVGGLTAVDLVFWTI